MQARELGRLRTGVVAKSNGKVRPKRSETWIVTSQSEDYIRAAADAWGGDVERWKPQGNGAEQWRVITGAATLDAILPPGDPVSQAYELWSRGGCQRRCDGVSDDITRLPCLCVKEFGQDFGARDDIPDGKACKATTRLNVILPALPDLGVFRAETHSYYAAMEIVATVDTVRGLVGAQSMVPIRLRIEQRTRIARGQTKQYSVIVVELRGPTAGQILSGDRSGLVVLDPSGQRSLDNGTQERRQLEAPAATPEDEQPVDWHARAMAVSNLDEWRALWTEANAVAELDRDPRLKEFMELRGKQLRDEASGEAAGEGAEPAASSEDGSGPSSPSSDDTTERAALWQQVLGADPMKTTTEARDAWLEFSGGEPFNTAPIEMCKAYATQTGSTS